MPRYAALICKAGPSRLGEKLFSDLLGQCRADVPKSYALHVREAVSITKGKVMTLCDFRSKVSVGLYEPAWRGVDAARYGAFASGLLQDISTVLVPF